MPASTRRTRRHLENWQAEVDSANQYRYLAESEEDPNLAQVFIKLAEVEEAHASFWESQLARAEVIPGPRKPSWRSRSLVFLAKHFSRKAVLSTIAAGERSSRNSYSVQPETQSSTMPSQERWHARILQEILRSGKKGAKGEFLARMEGRHRAAGGNALRAAVLGANDGLCSNLSLIMGVVGASLDSHQVMLTGIAGLLAGSLSMALGEFVSVSSARELAEREIRIESDELEADIQSEAKELQLIYQAKGLSESAAANMASQLLKDPAKALDTLTREELGINPEDLGGSPWEAAFASLILFAVGAMIPVFPFFFLGRERAVAISLLASAVGLFGLGALITLFTGRSIWTSALRQLLLGGAAASVTFAIGRWIGASIAL